MDTPAPPVLGVYVGHDSIDAVLVRSRGALFEPILRLSRPRTEHLEPHTAEALALELPGLSGAEDYTLEIGGGRKVASTAPPTDGLAGGDGQATPASGAFAVALKEILGECRAAGYPDVPIAFCMSAPDVGYVVVPAPADGTVKTAQKRKRVADEVVKQIPGADRTRVATVPFKKGSEYMLAVAPEKADPVLTTLSLLEGQLNRDLSVVRIDTEATLLAGLVGLGAVEGERTVVVRVGADDTLVLMFDGADLLGVERLRSLTAYELPETVVSRVILRLDEKKLEDPDVLYLASVGRTDQLFRRVGEMLPDAAARPLDELLGEHGVVLPQDESAYRAGPLVAAAIAARELSTWEVTPDVQLLPQKRLRRRRRKLPAVWHTALAAALLISALGVATVRYVQAEAETEALREDLRANPPVLPEDNPDLLQARVDSLNRAYATYTRSLDVLDSLLVGSDMWTQTMRLVTRSTVSTGGTWLVTWAPDGPNLRVQGRSLSRPQVVEMARRLSGVIEALSYTDIGARRVYTFDMLMPVPRELPQVAHFLREVRAGTVDSTLYRPEDMIVDPTRRRQ